MKVILSSCGNPDYGQVASRSLPGVRRRTVAITTLAEAAAVCRAYIIEHQLGSGNWSGGDVIDDEAVVVAHVSYNGRVWPATEWTPDTQPIH